MSENQINNRLKPCPFCGDAAELFKTPNGHYWIAGCTGCSAHFDSVESQREAIKIWNRRKNGDLLPEITKRDLGYGLTRESSDCIPQCAPID